MPPAQNKGEFGGFSGKLALMGKLWGKFGGF
jgi:hypothetical protein